MADETYVVNAVKEACCYVSTDWKRDIEICKWVTGISGNWTSTYRTRENPKKNSIVQEYVLPDFSAKSTSTTGYIRSGPNADPEHEGGKQPPKTNNLDEEEQVLWMGNERFQGPELLFIPSDIGESGTRLEGRGWYVGLNQSGLADTIAEIIAEMPEETRGMYWANIGIFGGLGYIDALGERL
jgi:actin-related protein 6